MRDFASTVDEVRQCIRLVQYRLVWRGSVQDRNDQAPRSHGACDGTRRCSVPFPFDVHMMISCNDAPGLENALHREFHKQRMNKVNFRKEFFRVDLDAIRKVAESQHGEVEYRAEPEALQYRESMNMPDEDYEFIEHTVESVRGDDGDSFSDEE